MAKPFPAKQSLVSLGDVDVKTLVLLDHGHMYYSHMNPRDHLAVLVEGELELRVNGHVAHFAAPHVIHFRARYPHHFYACGGRTVVALLVPKREGMAPAGTGYTQRGETREWDYHLKHTSSNPDHTGSLDAEIFMGSLHFVPRGHLRARCDGLLVNVTPVSGCSGLPIPDPLAGTRRMRFLVGGQIDIRRGDRLQRVSAPHSFLIEGPQTIDLVSAGGGAVLVDVHNSGDSTPLSDEIAPESQVDWVAVRQPELGVHHRERLLGIKQLYDAVPASKRGDGNEICTPKEQQEIITWVEDHVHFLEVLQCGRLSSNLKELPNVPECVWAIKRRLIESESLQQSELDPFLGDFIAYIPDGGRVHLHLDPNSDGLVHTRYNVLIQRPEIGGAPIYAGKKYQMVERTYIACVAGHEPHTSERVFGDKPRIFLSFGFQLPPERVAFAGVPATTSRPSTAEMPAMG